MVPASPIGAVVSLPTGPLFLSHAVRGCIGPVPPLLPLLGGLAITSHNGGAISTAPFDTVTVNACPSGWVCADIGGPSVPGGQSVTAGTWQVQGAGYGIFGSSDQFHDAWQTVAGDAAISARVLGQTNTNPYAKAGVMLRQDSSASAAYYFAYVTPGPAYGGVNVEYRGAAGATTVGLANPGGQPPVYLKVARAGTTYTAYSSADGVAWTAIPGSTVTFTATNALLAGLAVTSDCACQVSTGAFDTVAVTSRSSGNIPWHPHQSVPLGGGLAASVDLADGHIDVSADDLSVPGRRLGLALGHTWDSWLAQHGAATAAGPGWISDLTPSMGGVLTQTVVYTDASGARWDFPYQGNPGGSGPYTAYGTPPGQPWLLSTSPITGYVLTNYLSGEAWSFDNQGRYSADTDAYGNQNTMTQGPSGSTAETNSGGRALAFTYSNGLLSDAQSPLWQSGGAGAAGSQHVSYGYNAQGQLTTLTRGAGTTDALTATFGYSGTQLVTVTTPAGHAWSLGYDGQGRLTSITSPVSGTLGQTGYTPAYTTQVTYAPGLTQVIRGLGMSGALTTTYTLDALGQATQTQDGLGHTTHAAYDADHDVTGSSDANGNQTTDAYSYVGPGSTYGLLTQTTLPAVGLYVPGNTPTTSIITNRYDPTTHDLLETDKPEGGVALYAYNAFHSPITTTMLASDQGNSFCPNAVVRAPGAPAVQPLGTCSYVQQWRASVNRYDPYGERTSTVDGRGFVPSSLRTTSADGSVVPPTPQLDPVQAPLYTRGYAYTLKGDLQSESTPPLTTTLNGVTTSGPVTTTYGYDGDGHQTGVTTANGATTTTAYDHLGRQVSTTLPRVTLYDGSTSTPTSSTAYDGDGNAVRTSNANGETTTSSYDPWQRLVSSTNPVSGTTLYTYNASEQTSVRDPQGNVTQSAYDAAGRLSQTTDPSNNTTQYQYDAVGNTVAITSGTAGTVTRVETRTYDARNEVATDTTSGPGLTTALTTHTYYRDC